MAHLVNDMEKSGDLLKISQTDTAAFEVGKNLAVTPGKIVFQNDLFQLIQYAPTTDKVHEVPLLVVPPWINKFYILDLTPTKSFLKFAVDQGFTVFVVSWVNPDERLSHKSFEDYMIEGVLDRVRCGPARDGPREDQRARLLRRRHARRLDAGLSRRARRDSRSARRRSSPRRSISRRPAISCSSPTTRSSPRSRR